MQAFGRIELYIRNQLPGYILYSRPLGQILAYRQNVSIYIIVIHIIYIYIYKLLIHLVIDRNRDIKCMLHASQGFQF